MFTERSIQASKLRLRIKEVLLTKIQELKNCKVGNYVRTQKITLQRQDLQVYYLLILFLEITYHVSNRLPCKT